MRTAIPLAWLLIFFACSRSSGPQPGVPQAPSSTAPDGGVPVADGGPGNVDGLAPDAGTPPDAGTRANSGAPRMRGSLCDVGGWCWESPLPQGNWLRAIAVAGPNQIWFGGESGALFRWTAAGFEGTIGEITADRIVGLYARAAGDVWAATTSAVLHFDGKTWSEISDVSAAPNVQFSSLTGAADGAIFVAGSASGAGFVSRFASNAWLDTSLPSTIQVHALWAQDKAEAYATTWSATGTVLHWNGSFWEFETAGDSPLVGVWGSGRDDIWAAGAGAIIVHRDARGWRTIQPSSGYGEYLRPVFTSVVGSSPSDAWAIGSTTHWQRASGCVSEQGLVAHWDGVRWSPVPIEWNTGNCYIQSSVLRAAASDGAKIWFVGDQGVIAVADVSGVRRISSVPDIRSIWGAAPDRIYATAGPNILRRDESGWVPYRTAASKGSFLDALHGNGTEFVAVMDRYFAIHFAADGTSTASSENVLWPSSYVGDTRATWMTEDGQAFVAGRQGGGLPANVLHWDGTRWSSAALPGGDAGLAMFATSSSDVWAAAGRAIFHFDGAQWRDASDPAIYVSGFWRDFAGLVGCGSNATGPFARWDGAQWRAMNAPVAVTYIASLWPAGQDEVWLLGEAVQQPQQFRLYHLRDARIDSARVPWLFSSSRVFGVGDDGWVYGVGGEVLHRRFGTR